MCIRDSCTDSLTATLAKRLWPLKRTAAAGMRTEGAPPVGAMPAEHAVPFPATSAEVFSLTAAQLDALDDFYGDGLFERARSGAPLRERREAFARAIGAL